MTSATPRPRAGEHDGLGPHITKFGSIKEISGKLEFHDFEVDCEGAQIGILTSFMTRLIVTRLLTNLEQEFAAERDLLRERERELVEALSILYDETADYIRTNHLGDVHHNRSMQLARTALAKGRLS